MSPAPVLDLAAAAIALAPLMLAAALTSPTLCALGRASVGKSVTQLNLRIAARVFVGRAPQFSTAGVDLPLRSRHRRCRQIDREVSA